MFPLAGSLAPLLTLWLHPLVAPMTYPTRDDAVASIAERGYYSAPSSCFDQRDASLEMYFDSQGKHVKWRYRWLCGKADLTYCYPQENGRYSCDPQPISEGETFTIYVPRFSDDDVIILLRPSAP
jgi:hypothetical protein